MVKRRIVLAGSMFVLYIVSRTAFALPDYERAVRFTLGKLSANELTEQHKRCTGKETEYCGIVRSVVIKKMFDGNIAEYDKWRRRK